MTTANTLNANYGASGNVIVSGGSSSPLTNVASSAVGGMILLNTYTPSAAASVDITSQISSTYTSYRIYGHRVSAGTNNDALNLLFSTNNGSTWDTTAGHYRYSYIGANSTPTTSTAGSTSTTAISLATAVNSTAGSGATFVLDIVIPSVANVNVMWQLYGKPAGVPTANIGVGSYIAGTSINAVQLIMSTGTITASSITIFGLTA